MTQVDLVQKAVNSFGAATKAKLSNIAATGQREDQLRGPLEALLPALAEALGQPTGATTLVGETAHAATGTRPDYSVVVANALIGFIEVKAPGKGADPRKFSDPHDKAQWDKLKALPNLLYTDGNSFSLWRNGEREGPIVTLDGEVDSAGAKLAAPPTLLPLIATFLSWTPIPPKSARELAPIAARLCRFLRDEVIEAMADANSPLVGLAKDWRTLLFPDADNERFADGYAQAVTFGLLMARSLKLPLDGDLDAVAKKFPDSNSLIGTALRILTEDPASVSTSLKTMTRVLNEVDWDKISKGDPEAWLYFYESFLDVYDKKLRKLTGSYYTPPEVVQAMVRLCDEALKSPRYGMHKGLAAPNVHIADPATGSGTYLLALLRHIYEAYRVDGGEGYAAEQLTEAATRLYGFELQFGAFAVAQLRLMAEMIALGAGAPPRLFVTDTLGNPYEHEETGTGIGRQLSKMRIDANRIKAEQPITLVIGNPPYKEKAKGKGGWVEAGRQGGASILSDWQPPAAWKVGAHTKHLRNLYVYFWRWAAWKVFEQGAGGRDKEPPVAENPLGMVCYITVSGFLNGPGFQKMRADLRRECDDIWIIDCSPEGHQPEVNTRIFEGVQHPVCIVLASRSPDNDPAVPAKVRFRSLAKGRRDDKFAELAGVALGGAGWVDCGIDWRSPFLPEFTGGWADFVPLDAVISYVGPGVTAGRTWVIAPDTAALAARWTQLLVEEDPAQKEILFHPTFRKDKKTGKYIPSGRHIRKTVNESLGYRPVRTTQIIEETELKSEFARYGFRSFNRQYLLADPRVLSDPRPKIWDAHSGNQLYLTAPMDLTPSTGPALTITALPPDKHHYAGRGGHIFALWKDAAATQTNVNADVIAALTRVYGTAPDPVDVFAYVAALLAHPAYVASFKADLIRPGLRVPLTADKDLFAEAAKLGREVIWLHSFGERMGEGRPPGEPKLPDGERPTQPKAGMIPATPEGFPDTIDYDPALKRLKLGAGFIDNVPKAVWDYEVSGKQVLRQWFSYRKKNRERPQIGDKRPPSPLQTIQPDHWLPEYTVELMNVLNVLGLLVKLEPRQADVLARVVAGPLIPAGKI